MAAAKPDAARVLTNAISSSPGHVRIVDDSRIVLVPIVISKQSADRHFSTLLLDPSTFILRVIANTTVSLQAQRQPGLPRARRSTVTSQSELRESGD